MKEDVGVFKVVMWKEQICKAKVEIQVNCELGYMLQSWAPASLEAAVKTACMSSEISENSMGYSQLPKENKNYTSGSRMLECVTAALFQKPPTAHTLSEAREPSWDGIRPHTGHLMAQIWRRITYIGSSTAGTLRETCSKTQNQTAAAVGSRPLGLNAKVLLPD